MSWYPVLLKAIHLANKGVKEDENKNYAEALKLYEHCEGSFLYAIKHEAKFDKIKEVLRSKLKIYQDRANILRSHLAKKEFIHKRRQRCPYFHVKARKTRAGSPRPDDGSQLDNRLSNLKDVNKKSVNEMIEEMKIIEKR